MPDAPAFEALKNEVDLLGRVLGEAIQRLSGPGMFEMEEEIRHLAKRLRQDPGDKDAARAFQARLTALSTQEAEVLVRAFLKFFLLANLAEDRHRQRVNRLRESAATPEAPREESLLALIGELKAMGLGPDEAEEALARLTIHLTFTAHPTEVRRRTVRHHLERLWQHLEKGPDLEAIQAQVEVLWATLELRPERPSVEDEAKGGLAYLHTTLWEAIARFARALDEAFQRHYGRGLKTPRFPFRFRSWIGGDRDGNPNVTPEVTAWVQKYAQERLLERYQEALGDLIRDLSFSKTRVKVPPSLQAAADEYARRHGLSGRFSGEPFRRYLLGLYHELEDDPALLAPSLAHLEASLNDAGLERSARVLVRPERVRAETFGATLCPLDLREESAAHRRAVDEMLEVAGVMRFYAEADDETREAVLTRELLTPRPLLPVGYRPQSRALQLALQALSAWRHRGAYVVSMTKSPADLLEVLALAREVGLFDPRRGAPFDVVPLFETLADLEAAPRVVRKLIENPVFKRHLRARGGLEVMIGYSDSNKDAGFFAANWALFKAQRQVAEVGREAGVPIFFFHGRGTSTARGGGPAGRFLAALPPGSLGTRMRLTEQGEALSEKYAHPELAMRNLEQIFYHFALATLSPPPPPKPEWEATMEEAARASVRSYRDLVDDPEFLRFFESLTPIHEIARLKIASRPVWRHGRVEDRKNLRAIPWVMAWTQVRLLVPGWYGVEAGLEAIPKALRREMHRSWPFFRSLLASAAQSLAIADPGVARAYLRLVEKRHHRFLKTIEAAHTRAIERVEETQGAPLLADQPTLARALKLRNPYVDPLNHLQVELLRRYRNQPEDHPEREGLERALLLSILGIAAGLRNAG